MKPRATAAVLAAIFTVALVSVAGAETFPQTHEGWQLGLGVGAGSAGVSGGGSRETGAAGMFQVGYALNQQVAVELNSTAWSKSQDGTTVTFSVAGVGLAAYPSDGFVVRAGIGAGRVSASASSGGFALSASQSGLGVTAGAGYDFRVRRTFAIGPEIDFGYISINGESADYVNGTLAFHWYFVPVKK